MRPHFVCFKSELDDLSLRSRGSGSSLNESTSVMKLKGHFFSSLASFGRVSVLDLQAGREDVRRLFARPETVFVMMHAGTFPAYWHELPKRTLQHSLGSFLLPEYLFGELVSRANTISMVTTGFQAQRIRHYFKDVAPRLGVFTPRLDERIFFPPTAAERARARKSAGLRPGEKHIVYAGRWLPGKGICQIIRALSLWPLKGARVTFAGDFSPHFRLHANGANHLGFEEYFRRNAGVSGASAGWLRLAGRLSGDALRRLLWSADLFVYPSVHEDENFGLAPREAILCGVPALVTDFCGLHPLAALMPWAGVPTYPAFTGPRFSLYRLRELIARALESDNDRVGPASAVRSECDPARARNNLREATACLLGEPLKKPPDLRLAERRARLELIRHADEKIAAVFLEKSAQPQGALVQGLGVHMKNFPFHAFFRTLQGIYTSTDTAWQVKRGDRLRGFFPVAAWKELRAVVELGYPGPRMRQYAPGEWNVLCSCVRPAGTGELSVVVSNKDQARLAQELVDLGYLVPDHCC